MHAAASPASIRWDFRRFHELDLDALYALLRLRSEVFVVEQNCPYLDPDGKDRHPDARHLLGWTGADAPGEPVLAAALRILPAGLGYPEVSFGRVVIAPAFRGQGLGHALVREALVAIAHTWPGMDVRIGAQAHLEAFYGRHGFARASEPYLEDGIPHVDMLRKGPLPAHRSDR